MQNTKATAKTAIISNLILSLIFKNAMSMLLASILIFQLLAHLPLADIVLPANALQWFEIMISIVSFDFFSPTEYFDIGLTETEPWSTNFAWLGYESVNFIEGMGSILLVGIYLALIGIVAILLALSKRKVKCPCI